LTSSVFINNLFTYLYKFHLEFTEISVILDFLIFLQQLSINNPNPNNDKKSII